nr:hypothetical protein [Schaedlerella arabinosiphila]
MSSICGEGSEQLPVAEKQGIKFMRKHKDHMEVRRVNDFGTALIYPDFF